MKKITLMKMMQMRILMDILIIMRLLMRTCQRRSLSSLSSCSDGDEEAFRANGTVYPAGKTHWGKVQNMEQSSVQVKHTQNRTDYHAGKGS